MALNSNFRTLTADNIEGIVDEKNYLKSSFENGSTQGWTEMSVALTGGLPSGTPTISSTAASSLALSATSSTPLSGSRSLLMNVPTSLAAGHGFISEEFTLDRMDLGKVLTVSFDYERVTGTLNFSGALGSQTLMVYIYDATAGGANWIQPAGFLGMNQSSGPGRVSCTFQSSVVAGQKYRVAVIASQAAAGALSLEFDNFTCSRVAAPIGPIVTDWVSYTPTLKGTVSDPTLGSTGTITGRWRRVGDSLQVQMQAAASGTGISVGSGNYYLTIPAGLSIDTSRIVASVGTCEAFHSGVYSHTGISIAFNSLGVGGITSDNLSGGVIGQNYPATNWWTASCFITINAQVPISGWSSATQLSNDSDTRVVAMRAKTSVSQPMTSPFSNPTVIKYETVEFDTHATYSTTSGLYTCPVSGFFKVSTHYVGNSAAYPAGSSTGAWVRKNGSNYSVITADRIKTAATAPTEASGSTIVQCNAGDTLAVALYSDIATTTQSPVPDFMWMCIERVSGPSVIASSETVAMRATKISGAHTSNGNTQIVASWNSVVQDTHGIFNATSGAATIPVSGTYFISAIIGFTANSTGGRACAIRRNNSDISESNVYLSFGERARMLTYCILKCNAGDLINIGAFQNSGGNLNYDSFSQSSFELVRVGN